MRNPTRCDEFQGSGCYPPCRTAPVKQYPAPECAWTAPPEACHELQHGGPLKRGRTHNSEWFCMIFRAFSAFFSLICTLYLTFLEFLLSWCYHEANCVCFAANAFFNTLSLRTHWILFNSALKFICMNRLITVYAIRFLKNYFNHLLANSQQYDKLYCWYSPLPLYIPYL